MAKPEYTSIKVTTDTHRRILAFRAACFERGTNSLPKGIVPENIGLSGFIRLALDIAERQLKMEKRK